MMKKIAYLMVAALMTVSCSLVVSDPYEKTLHELMISVVFPEGYESLLHEGVIAKIEDINLGNRYECALDAEGKATISLPVGLYRVSVSDRIDKDIFNATIDRFSFSSAVEMLDLDLKHTKAGSIVIKEIYCGGCRKEPSEGTYMSDKYVILHNNDVDVQYLDSLCFGYLLPYNANATNPFLEKIDGKNVYKDYVAIADAVWQFPGDGHTFPLQPGEDAVVCVNGAIDHAASYPLSVNLNKSEYFVMYNANYFTNKTYHPVPGNNIQDDHILNCVVKTNPSLNAVAMSINSPAVVVYRAKGMSIEQFVSSENGVIPVPGSTNGAKVLACPLDWVLDAVEVFNGSSSANVKRLQDVLDAGQVTQSNTFLGHTLMRRVDEELTANSGYEVLMDTNNSSNDMYESEKQSLHE